MPYFYLVLRTKFYVHGMPRIELCEDSIANAISLGFTHYQKIHSLHSTSHNIVKYSCATNICSELDEVALVVENNNKRLPSLKKWIAP